MITVNDYENCLTAADVAKDAGFKLVVDYGIHYVRVFKLEFTLDCYGKEESVQSFTDLNELIYFCKIWKLSRWYKNMEDRSK